jgi:DNA-binding transcriptional LysR family regulator
LHRHACLTLGDAAVSSQARGWLFMVDDQLQGFRLDGPLECNDGAVLHDWAISGLGLAWRSLWEVGDDIAAGRLVSVLDQFAAPPTRVYCVFPARKHLPLRVRLFVDFLKDRFSTAPLAGVLRATEARPEGRSPTRRPRPA